MFNALACISCAHSVLVATRESSYSGELLMVVDCCKNVQGCIFIYHVFWPKPLKTFSPIPFLSLSFLIPRILLQAGKFPGHWFLAKITTRLSQQLSHFYHTSFGDIWYRTLAQKSVEKTRSSSRTESEVSRYSPRMFGNRAKVTAALLLTLSFILCWRHACH